MKFITKALFRLIYCLVQPKVGIDEDKGKRAHPRTTNVDEDIDKVVERGRD
jgi:hypothetical protein